VKRTVYLEPEETKMKRNNILIGGALAGVIAVVCALALANTMKRTERKK
jgi:hypothetical protein